MKRIFWRCIELFGSQSWYSGFESKDLESNI